MKRAIPLLTVMAPAPVVKPKRERLPVEQAIAGGEATNEEKGGPRVLLKIEEIQLHYGEDENNPRPFEVKDENGKLLFTSDPYVN